MLKLKDTTVAELSAAFPRRGAWSAYADLPERITLSVGERTQLQVDSLSLSCTVVSVDTAVVGHTKAHVVGGAGGMSKTISAKNYGNGPSLRTVLVDMLVQQGEVLSADSDKLVLLARLRTWQAFADVPLGEQVSRLLESQGASWRFSDDGSVVVVVDRFNSQLQLPTDASVSESSAAGSVTYSVPSIDKVPRPGTTFGEVMINEVVINADPRTTLVTLHQQQLSDFFSYLKRSDARLSALYPGSVVKQNDDGTLDVNPDDVRIKGAGLQRLDAKFGVPGVTVAVSPGERVYVAYDANDANRPFVAGFEGERSRDFLITLGKANEAQFVALANIVNANFEALKTYLDNLKTGYDAHTHPTGVGPSGPPAAPAPTPEASDDVACTRLKTA